MNLSESTSCTAKTRNIVRDIDFHLRQTLSPRRLEHSLETASLCAGLCERFGVDPEQGIIAGLGHDIAREYPRKDLLAEAGKDGLPVSAFEEERPVLLHGRAGAVVLRKAFGIDDEEILYAVRHHTLGHPDAGILAKILYVADYCEPTRTFIDDGFRSSCLGLPLDRMVLRILEDEKVRRKILAPPTRAMYDKLKEKAGEE